MDGLKCIMYEGAFSSTVGSDDLESEKFGEYVAKFHETVFRVAFGYTKNHADTQDIEQDVFLKLDRCGRNFESDERVADPRHNEHGEEFSAVVQRAQI